MATEQKLLVRSVQYVFLLNENAKVNFSWRSSLVLYSACHTNFWLPVSWNVVVTSLSNLCTTPLKWMRILVPRPKQNFLLVLCNYTVDETNNVVAWKSAHGQSTLQLSLPKRGVGTLSRILEFNYERVPTSRLQRLKQQTQRTCQHSEQHHYHHEHGLACRVHHISYVCLPM